MTRTSDTPTEVREGTLRLHDGRTLGYLDIGTADDYAILCCHGTPGSRLDFRADIPRAQALGVRLIVPDRPGYGLSDFRRGTYLDWAEDAAELLDALGLDHVAVLGVSGGVGYATACAYQFPDRVRRLGLISTGNLAGLDGVPSPRSLSHLIARWAPWLPYRGLYDLIAALRRADPSSQVRTEQQLGRRPRDVNPDTLSPATLEVLWEAFRQGGSGYAWDGRLAMRPLGFNPGRLVVKTVLWEGGRDVPLLLAVARALAQAIPDCQAHIFPGEGHNVLATHWHEIFRTLAAEPGD